MSEWKVNEHLFHEVPYTQEDIDTYEHLGLQKIHPAQTYPVRVDETDEFEKFVLDMWREGDLRDICYDCNDFGSGLIVIPNHWVEFEVLVGEEE